MKPKYPAILLILLGGLVSFWGHSSLVVAAKNLGSLRTINVNQQGFSSLSLGYSVKATVTPAATWSVVIRISESAADDLEVERRGKTLFIGLKPGRSHRNLQFLADIEMPDLEKLDLSGASSCELSGFNLGHDVEFELSGASRLLGQLTSTSIDFSASGGSNISLAGESDSVALEGSGGAKFEMVDFNTRDLKVNLSGGSKAEIHMSGRLTGDLSGGSHLSIKGTLSSQDVSASGGSRVSRD